MLMPREGTQSRIGLGRDCYHSHVCCGPAANTLGPNPQDPWGTLPPPRRGRLQSRHSPSSFEPSSRTACRAPGTVLDAGFRVTHKHTSACAHGVCIRAGKTKTESEGSSRPRPRARGGSGARRVRLHPPHTGKAAFPVARLLGDGPPGHHRPAARQRQAAPAPALARGTKAIPVPSAPPPRKRAQPARLGLVMPPVHPRDQVNTHTLCRPVQPDHTASGKKRSHVPPMLRADGTQGPLMAPQGPPMAPRVPLVAPQVPDGTARLPDGARGCDVLHDTSALVRIHLFSELAFTCL